VQAFVQAELDDAIPMDQIILTWRTGEPCLLLPSGTYVVVQDEDGKTQVVEPITQP
jgi:hypothetical protein